VLQDLTTLTHQDPAVISMHNPLTMYLGPQDAVLALM
jgi:hypothetical protein